MRSAVVLLVFNRPELTSRVLAAIRQARPSRVLVVADGPREGHPTDAARCAEVRAIIEHGIDWACVVERNYAERNLGCGRRVSSGLDWAFSLVEEAIILEDDCVPDASFFPFCAELLARYRDEPGVAQIAGCSFQDPGRLPSAPSYYFSRYPHCWGWATWRRAWRHYDHEMTTWRDGRNRTWLKKAFERSDERRWWAAAFDGTIDGRIDTWDFRWTLTTLSRGWLSVLPYRNLVTNIGMGAEATNTQKKGRLLELPAQPMPFPLVHPEVVRRDIRADAYSGRRLFRAPGFAWMWLRGVRDWLCR